MNVSVISGNIYTFSTCVGTTWDSQITLYDNFSTFFGYNDDACGLQSSLSWTATFTGQIRVLVDQYSCTNNVTCAQLNITCASPSPNTNCSSAMLVCTPNTITGTPNSFGTQDLTMVNAGCMLGFEHQSRWFVIHTLNAGIIQFTVTPSGFSDFDFAMWGPFGATYPCPPTSTPIRCSFSPVNTTGLNSTSTDAIDGTGGVLDGWCWQLPVLANQNYLLVVDNFSNNGLGFTLNFNGTTPNTIGCITLPIELLFFEGKYENPFNKLYWSTATEEDNEFFTIERSIDLIDWEEIGTLDAIGNSSQQTDYSMIDGSFKRVLNYYRLKQTDKNSSFKYFNTITIDNTMSEIAVPLKTTNYLGQEVDDNYRGFVIKYYKFGPPIKVFQDTKN